MLRITILEDLTAVVLTLEGNLAGEWVPELERVWARLQSDSLGRQMVLVLTELSGIDESGRLFLKETASRGAELKGSGIGINELIVELTGNKV